MQRSLALAIAFTLCGCFTLIGAGTGGAIAERHNDSHDVEVGNDVPWSPGVGIALGGVAGLVVDMAIYSFVIYPRYHVAG